GRAGLGEAALWPYGAAAFLVSSTAIEVKHIFSRRGTDLSGLPLNLERTLGLAGPPVTIRHHGNAMVSLDHRLHTRHGLGRRGIKILHPPARHGRAAAHRMVHPRQLHIAATGCRAEDLGRSIQPLIVLA